MEADVVVPVPDSGIYAALGFAEEVGIPYDPAFVRNHYIGRTFIQPNDHVHQHHTVRDLQNKYFKRNDNYKICRFK